MSSNAVEPKLNYIGLIKVEFFKHFFDFILDHLTAVCPLGDDFTAMKTKLDEAHFLAIKSICSDQNNRENMAVNDDEDCPMPSTSSSAASLSI
jgi:hypothetical protein